MNRLKELRKEKRLTQKKLAQEIGVSKVTITRWENEEKKIKIDKAQQLADFFGVSLGYLLGFTEIDGKKITDDFLEKLYLALKEELSKYEDENYSISEQLKSVISRLRFKNLSDVERVEIRKLSLELLEETL